MRHSLMILLVLVAFDAGAEPQCDNPRDAETFKEYCENKKLYDEHEILFNEALDLMNAKIDSDYKYSGQLKILKSNFIDYIDTAEKLGGLSCFFQHRDGMIPEGQGAGGANSGGWCAIQRTKERIEFIRQIKASCQADPNPCFET